MKLKKTCEVLLQKSPFWVVFSGSLLTQILYDILLSIYLYTHLTNHLMYYTTGICLTSDKED